MKATAHGIGAEREHIAHGTPFDLVTAVGTAPRTVYRASFPLSFAPPTPETTVAIDPDAARLEGRFVSLDQDVPAGAISESGGRLVVQLDGPRQVVGATFATSGGTAQLFRMDGSKVAPQETVSAGLSGSTVFFPSFTDVRFTLGIQDSSISKANLTSLAVRGQPTGARLGIADAAHPDQVTFFWPGPKDTGNDANAGQAFGAALQQLLATTHSVLVVMQSDQPCTFVRTSLATGASFALDGFAFPLLSASDLTDAAGLAARIRAGGDPVSAHLRTLIGDSALLDGLNAAIGGASLYDAQRFAGVTLSAQTQVELAAGDVPRLNRLLLQDAYPDAIAAPAADRVVRFDGRSASDGVVAVRLPAGATVSKATIATDESVRADRGTNGGLAALAGLDHGVHVGSEGTTAVAVSVDEAVSATGVALPLVALGAGTVVSVELQDDFQGSPSGKRLAGGTVSLAAPGTRQWSTLFFDAVVIPSGPAWLVLRASKGEAVWLAAADAGSVRVVHAPDHESGIATALPALKALYELFSRSGDAAAQPATTLAVAGAQVAGSRDGSTATYDFKAALQAALHGGGTDVELAFTSPVAGTLTVHPPHVEYHV